jgi:hypothetical protein
LLLSLGLLLSSCALATSGPVLSCPERSARAAPAASPCPRPATRPDQTSASHRIAPFSSLRSVARQLQSACVHRLTRESRRAASHRRHCAAKSASKSRCEGDRNAAPRRSLVLRPPQPPQPLRHRIMAATAMATRPPQNTSPHTTSRMSSPKDTKKSIAAVTKTEGASSLTLTSPSCAASSFFFFFRILLFPYSSIDQLHARRLARPCSCCRPVSGLSLLTMNTVANYGFAYRTLKGRAQ